MPFRRIVLAVVCCVFVALGSISASSQTAESVVKEEPQKLVEQVDIMGNRLTTDEKLSLHIKTRPGQWYSQEQAEADLKSLLSLGIFYPKNTRLRTEEGSRGGVIVIFEVRELPVIAKITVEGLRAATDREMRAYFMMQLFGSEENHVYYPVYNSAKIPQLLKDVKQLLADDGWTGVDVDVSEAETSATTIEIKFIIKGKSPVRFIRAT